MQNMILKAQKNYNVDSFFYIMCSWLTFTTCVLSYFLEAILKDKINLIWLLMLLGGSISIIYFKKKSKKQKVQTHVETHVNQVWLTMGLAFIFLIIGASLQINFEVIPTIILLYGSGIFCTGSIINFLPMVLGGAVCFPLFLFSSYFLFVDYISQFLVLAFAILVSYIIRGHLFKAKLNI